MALTSASLAGEISVLRSLNRVAGRLGYPWPVRAAVNVAPVDLNLDVQGHVAPQTYLQGDVTVEPDAAVLRGSLVKGTVTLEESATLGQNTEVRGDVEVGRYANLAGNNWVRGDVTIGDFAAIGPEVSFQSTSLDPEQSAMQQEWQRRHLGREPPQKNEPIRLGGDVWIGREATVLRDVDIGHGGCVGACAVVTRDVEPFEIVAGVPAEHLGWRFDEETRRRMLDLSWWEWDLEQIVDRFDEIESLVDTDLAERLSPGDPLASERASPADSSTGADIDAAPDHDEGAAREIERDLPR